LSKIKLALLAALLLTGLTAATEPARAATTTTACQLFGTTPFVTPAVQLTGGTGTFTLEGSGTCSVDGAPRQPGSVTGSGWYDYAFCSGPGDWFGTLAITIGARTLTVPFQVRFVAGNGVVVVGSLSDAAAPQGSGSMVTTPAGLAGVGMPPDCITKFNVTATLAVRS
jgi:hypothetical protein